MKVSQRNANNSVLLKTVFIPKMPDLPDRNPFSPCFPSPRHHLLRFHEATASMRQRSTIEDHVNSRAGSRSEEAS